MSTIFAILWRLAAAFSKDFIGIAFRMLALFCGHKVDLPVVFIVPSFAP